MPITMIVIAFVAYSLPPYLTFDPGQARIPFLRADLPIHYTMLVAHVWTGTIAILAGPLQLWPWLRRTRPTLHRFVGRVYVFGGMLPSAVLALGIAPFSASAPGNVVAALLWLGCTFRGYRAARARHFAEHRRWMIYGYALCTQILWGRLMIFTLPLVPGFDPAKSIPAVLETATWIGFVFNLLIAQWWLERTARRNHRQPLPTG